MVGEIEIVSLREAEMRARETSPCQRGSLVPGVPEVLPLLPAISQIASNKHSCLIKIV